MSFALSVLDLVPITAGMTSTEAIGYSIQLAQMAERAGYTRFWLAEHHGMPNIASSSPEILIARIARETERIRVGAGGIMLPNHAPLRVRGGVSYTRGNVPGAYRLRHRPGAGHGPGYLGRAASF